MATKGFDDDGFYVEIYSKSEIDDKFENVHHVYTGSTEPSTTLGSIGDVYIKTEE